MKKIQIAICILGLTAHPALASEESGPALEAEPSGELVEAAPGAGAELPAGSVARASFTTAIVDREPRDSVSRLPNDASEVHFFTELRGFTGHTLTHVWKRDGVPVARVPFSVNGPRWRVYSTKTLQPEWLGQWTVTVMDENDNLLGTESFEFVAAATAPVAQATPAAAPAQPSPAVKTEAMAVAAPTDEPEEEAPVIRFDERYRDNAVPAAMD